VDRLGAIHADSKLVGRQREMALLWDLFQAAAKGQPGVALVAGEPGIGKTRLLQAFADRIGQAEAAVLQGGASEAEGMPPYLPFLEALGQYIRTTTPEVLRLQTGPMASILAAILPELALHLGELPTGYPLPPEQARFRLYEAVGNFLKAIAAGPLVLILDDLHWADTASLDLLGYLARYQGEEPLLFVGAYREGEVAENPGFQRLLAELNRLRLLTPLTIGPLSSADITVLTSAYLAGPPAPAVDQLLYTQSEGNPFFAEELLRGWLESGTLAQRGQEWTFIEPPEPELPAGIIGAVGQRLNRLPSLGVEYLRTAAIIGRRFEAAFLAHVSGQEEELVEEHLHQAVQAQLLRLEQAGTFIFSHDTIRQCLYNQVTAARRKRLHGFIGRALEVQPEPSDTQQLADLAFHFTHSGDRHRGVLYARRAAEQAAQAYAYHQALLHYQTALKLLDHTDEQRGEVLMKLGEAALLAGAEPEAIAAFETAQVWFEQTGDTLAAARAAHGLGQALWRLEMLPRARAAFETALALTEAQAYRGPETVKVLVDLGSLLAVSLHQYPEGITYGQRALQLAHQLEDERLVAAASRTVGNLLVRSNDLPAGLPLLEQALSLATAGDDLVEAAECCACLGMAYGWNTHFQQTFEVSQKWVAFAQRCHDLYQLRHVYSLLAIGHSLQGQWAEAEQMIASARPVVERLASPEPLLFFDVTRGSLAYFRGDYPVAEQFLTEAISSGRTLGPGTLVWYLGLLGLVQVAQEKWPEARAGMDELEALIATLPPNTMLMAEPLTHLTMLALQVNDQDRLAHLYPRLVPFRGQFHDALIDRLLGEIETRQGDWPAARASLAAAEATARREELKPELAFTLAAQAELELARGGPGSAGRARKLFGQAQALFQSLGNRGEARRLRTRLRSLPSQPGIPPQTPLPAGLSRREAEVLRLVAAGQSNRQIAQTLALSEKTIANHLTHIFNKLGVDNRAAAAAFAVRHKLD
jgi:DNA-binding CsgD family transcriptional regulator